MAPEPAPEGPRLLWIKTELLHPVDKGGKIRTIEMLKRLKPRHHITYLTLDDGTAGQDARERAGEYCHELVCVPFRPAPRGSLRFYAEALRSLASPLPYAISRYRSEAMRRAILDRAPACDVVVSDFLVSAVNCPDTLARPSVLFQHNVEAEIWRRHALNQRNVAVRAFFRAQWRRMEAYERRACRAFDSVVAVSDDDCSLLRLRYGLERVAAVPTGVDTDFFRPRGAEAVQPRTLVFTGSMDWMPNQDAIRFFLDEIMPLIAKEVPGVRLLVVGRSPNAALKALAASRPDVIVTGRVDDVRPFIGEARCYVVPIRIGGGTRLKIFEAMAMGKPVVSTTIGAEGLPIVDGQDLIVADTPAMFAAAVVRIVQDDELALRLGAQAAATVRERFSWERVADRFSQLCGQAAGSHQQA